MEREVAAITGATGGIGGALTEEAIARGYDPVLHGRSEAKLDAPKHPEIGVNTVGDLDSAEGVQDVASRIAAETGSLDLLINNVGVTG